ncbi:hypothetical protein V5F53_02065 [Xanthobacter sp. V4C-4]|uniref:tetratricopeptide repeat protein n=1 Tax=Xanthobacter cornucopiae TaxID=3119924 RepID=UPI003728FCA7
MSLDETGEAPGSGLSMQQVQLALGQMHLDRGDHAAALDWFRTAARAGDACGFNMIGRCHDCGWGVPADPAAAARYYLRAAELGDVWALFNLADLYCCGRGVARDDGAAYTLYLAAARRGHAKALNMLGLFHEDGRVVAADPDGALELFRAAAAGGDCWGSFNSARLHLARGEEGAALDAFEHALETGFPDFFATMAQALADAPDPRFAALAARAAARAAPGGEA